MFIRKIQQTLASSSTTINKLLSTSELPTILRNLTTTSSNNTTNNKNVLLKNHPQSQTKRNRSTILPATDSSQLQELALDENCILVDENDTSIGYSSKRDCHRVDANGQIKLHRAFSVLLFNSNGDMLVQKRSPHKVTFPDCYTNACCSHPLYDINGESEELNGIGVRRAAQRRLNYELGIPISQVRPENFYYLTRIHYQDNGNGIWGEHEIDYILFLQKDVDVQPNPNEVSEICYVKKENFIEQIRSLNGPLTPWFKLIMENRLGLWWNNLERLHKYEDLKTIQKF